MKKIIFSSIFCVLLMFAGNANAYLPFGGADTALISCLNTSKTPEQRKEMCASSFIVKICSNNPHNFNIHSNGMCMLREYYAWKTALEVSLAKSPVLEKTAIQNSVTKNMREECKKAMDSAGADIKRLAYYKCKRDIAIAHTLDQYAITLNAPANSSLPNSGNILQKQPSIKKHK